MNKSLLAAAGATAAAILLVAGCAGTNHDAPNPPNDIRITWTRVETPPSFTTLMFGCFGHDGILMDQEDGNANVTPNDPQCPAKGGTWQWVKRSGDKPPVVISTQNGPVPVQVP